MPFQFTSPVAWANDNFAYRRPLSPNCVPLSGSLTDFPAMVKLDDARFGWQSKVLANGNDVYFYDSAGNLLDWEWESFDRTAVSWGHLKLPTLTAGSRYADRVWMYYGYAGAAQAWDAAGVWSNGFTSVYHCSEASGNLLNSVGASLAMVPNGTPLYGQAGRMGNCVGVDSATDFWAAAGSYPVQSAGSDSVWIKRTSTIVEAWHYFLYPHQYRTVRAYPSGSSMYIDGSIFTTTGWQTISSGWITGGQLFDGNWHHLMFTYDAVAGTMNLYRDGVLWFGPTAMTGTPNISGAARIAYPIPTPFALDEIRYAGAARSITWPLAETLSGLNKLIDWGPEERRSA